MKLKINFYIKLTINFTLLTLCNGVRVYKRYEFGIFRLRT